MFHRTRNARGKSTNARLEDLDPIDIKTTYFELIMFLSMTAFINFTINHEYSQLHETLRLAEARARSQILSCTIQNGSELLVVFFTPI